MPNREQTSAFLSTPSARRATSSTVQKAAGIMISIHALREEGDAQTRWRRSWAITFLSTPSARRATPITKPCSSKLFVFLSTPSARRATGQRSKMLRMGRHFYPRPPRGGRPWCFVHFSHELLISIHALREEGDVYAITTVTSKALFLSTPSARRATHIRGMAADIRVISIHALREEGDFLPGSYY